MRYRDNLHRGHFCTPIGGQNSTPIDNLTAGQQQQLVQALASEAGRIVDDLRQHHSGSGAWLLLPLAQRIGALRANVAEVVGRLVEPRGEDAAA